MNADELLWLVREFSVQWRTAPIDGVRAMDARWNGVVDGLE
jgi:hypothetical protein